MTMRKILKLAAISLTLLSVFMPAIGSAEDRPTLLYSYEVLNFEVHKIDPARLSYEERLQIAEKAKTEVVPKILDTVKITGEKVSTLAMPGGYQLETNASLQSSFETDNATADVLAAALGYTFRQWSVLVTDFAPAGEGDTAYGVVTFDHVISGPEADAFFKHAAKVNPALGAGFTAFDEEMFFLNVTDAQGKPYSGVDDETFIAALGKAAESFTADRVQMTGSGRADARFIENDWKASPDGEDYARRLGEDLTARLKALRAGHDAEVARELAKD